MTVGCVRVFRLQQAGLYHRSVAAPHLFAPALELLLAALDAKAPSGRILLLEPGAPLLFRAAALSPELKKQDLWQLNLDANDQAVRSAAAAIPKPWVRAQWSTLPFADASFDAIVANLVLGEVETDGEVISELHRVLKPGGKLFASALLAGTLEEFFDITREICEQQGLVESSALLADESSARYKPQAFAKRLSEAGFAPVNLGIENRAAPFSSGREFISDPVVQEVFLADWLGALADQKLRATALQAIAAAIDTYFLGIGFTARLVTGVVSASKAPETTTDAA